MSYQFYNNLKNYIMNETELLEKVLGVCVSVYEKPTLTILETETEGVILIGSDPETYTESFSESSDRDW